MTGVREATIYRLLKQRKDGSVTVPPKKSTGRKPIQLDDSDKQMIRKKVHLFYFQKIISTLDKVLVEINEDQSLPNIKRDKLWIVLHELDFVYAKQDRKSTLIEKKTLFFWRRQYLREIRKVRRGGNTIFYLDETWINEGHFVTKVWQDRRITNARQAFIEGLSTGLKAPTGKGPRLIITHIGGDKGFVEGGLLDFVSNSTKDYQEEMTSDVFEEYFIQMIDLLPRNSVIVMDNASYHSRFKEHLRNTKWKKQELLDWLISKNIQPQKGLHKPELLSLCKLHSWKFKRYGVDEIAKERKIKVLRLPPYHCELNPIELIWAQIKGNVARNNTTFELLDVRQLLKDSISKISSKNWENAIKHVMAEEEKFWTLDNLIEETLDPINISLEDEESDDDAFLPGDNDVVI
nr:unnamed protein product [Callosobruchus analis]